MTNNSERKYLTIGDIGRLVRPFSFLTNLRSLNTLGTFVPNLVCTSHL